MSEEDVALLAEEYNAADYARALFRGLMNIAPTVDAALYWHEWSSAAFEAQYERGEVILDWQRQRLHAVRAT